MKACRFCAEEIQDAAIVCKHCGRDLQSGTAHTTLQPKKRVWPLVLAGLLGLWAFAAFFNSMTVRNEQPAEAARNIAGMPEDQRHIILRNVITSADFKCAEVIKSVQNGGDRSNDIWNAYCFGGGSYIISVKPAGDTRVMPCGTAGVACAAGYFP